MVFSLSATWCALLAGHAAPLRGQRLTNLSHPSWQRDGQAVQSTNQRMEGLAINALLVQLYQPGLLSTGPAAKVPAERGSQLVPTRPAR